MALGTDDAATARSRPLRVMHVIASSASGGAPVNVARLIARSAMEHVVVIQRDDDENWNRLAALARAIHHLPIRTVRVSTLRRLMALAREHGVDVLHSHGPGAGLYARLAGSLLRLPVVHTYRGFHNRFKGWRRLVFSTYERTFSMLTTRAVAVSPSEKAKLLESKAISERKLLVLFNPIELPEGRPEIQLPLAPEKFNVVTLSRISPQKDLFTLMDVAAELGETFAFHVIGGVNSSDGDYARRVREKLVERGLSNFFLHGDLPNAAALLHHFDAYVSTALWEGLPTAVIEAFLAKVPVVATDCTGNCDVVRDGETGILCSIGDVAAIAAGLRRLAGDEQLRERLRRGAAEFAAREFDPVRLVARMDDVYREVTSKA
jgi:glycosyltransferase involved in cell wall biosynthesis